MHLKVSESAAEFVTNAVPGEQGFLRRRGRASSGGVAGLPQVAWQGFLRRRFRACSGGVAGLTQEAWQGTSRNSCSGTGNSC